MSVLMTITSIIAMFVSIAKTVTIAIYNGFDSHNTFDSYNGYNNYDKFIILGHVSKDLIFLEDFWLADASMVFYF